MKIPEAKVDISMDKLRDYEYLMSHFYTVDSSTMADANLINADRLLGKNMKLNSNSNEEAAGPKVLIYHTHSQEQFKDSVPGDANTSIVGMGTYLTDLLNQKYGIETYHHTGVYDLVNGKLDRSKAYQLAEPDVQKILKDNPSIEVVIDLHRDGVAEGTHLVTEVDGRRRRSCSTTDSAERGQMEISVIFRIHIWKTIWHFPFGWRLQQPNIIRDLPDTFSFGHTAITCISNRRHFWSRQEHRRIQ